MIDYDNDDIKDNVYNAIIMRSGKNAKLS